MLQTLLIGLALAMDAFAVSVSSGICIKNLSFAHALRASLSFGFFQFAMPVAGWFLGSAFAAYIGAFDHWIAFTLLVFIGGKTIIESWKNGAGGKPGLTDIRNAAALLLLSLATSVDALAVGVSLSFLKQEIWGNAALIGIVTFLVCLTGFASGRRLGLLFEKWAGTAGGLILAGIGVKILLEHLL